MIAARRFIHHRRVTNDAKEHVAHVSGPEAQRLPVRGDVGVVLAKETPQRTRPQTRQLHGRETLGANPREEHLETEAVVHVARALVVLAVRAEELDVLVGIARGGADA